MLRRRGVAASPSDVELALQDKSLKKAFATLTTTKSDNIGLDDGSKVESILRESIWRKVRKWFSKKYRQEG